MTKVTRKQMGYKELSLMVDATFKILNASKDSNTAIDDLVLEANFINIFMEKLITKIMSEKVKDDKAKTAQFMEVAGRLNMIKLYLQEAMALAFQEAMQKFTKMPIEYYCVVKAISNYPSKESH